MGNKTSILSILYSLFPLNYERYIEPFGGSGAVLLGKPAPDRFEVLNDYNRNLVNLYRCMRDRPVEFIRALGFLNLNARDDFNVLKKFFRKEEFDDAYFQTQLELTEVLLPPIEAREIRELYAAAQEDYDLRRAVMFLKLLRYSYSSGGKSFASQPFSIRSLFGLVQAFSKRCENVVIENQDFEVLIRHYDREGSFFYCDPPYFTSEYVYDCGFGWEDHLRLHRALRENSCCPTTTARRFAACTRAANSLILRGSTAWCSGTRSGGNFRSCSLPTTTFTSAKRQSPTN